MRPGRAAQAGRSEPAPVAGRSDGLGQAGGVHPGHPWGRSVRPVSPYPSLRYTRWTDGTAELYDQANDSEETRNLASDPALADVVGEHRRLLDGLPPLRSLTEK